MTLCSDAILYDFSALNYYPHMLIGWMWTGYIIYYSLVGFIVHLYGYRFLRGG